MSNTASDYLKEQKVMKTKSAYAHIAGVQLCTKTGSSSQV